MIHLIFYCQSYTCHKQSLQLQNELFIWREWIPERRKLPAWILLCLSFVTHFIPYLALVRLRAKALSSCPNRSICSSPFFFQSPEEVKNMTLLYWECFITPFVSALSLCLQSSRGDGKISSFLRALLMGRVSSGTSAWTSCYGLYRSYVATERVSRIALIFPQVTEWEGGFYSFNINLLFVM